MLLQMLLQVEAAVIVSATVTAFAFMCLMVVHLTILYGIRIVPAATLTGHVAANSRFVFDGLYYPSL